MWHMGDGWGWWMGSGTIMMVALLLLIIWAIGSLGQKPPRDATPTRSHEEPSALQILERRYANGELTNDEFEEKRQFLNRSRGNGMDQTQAER